MEGQSIMSAQPLIDAAVKVCGSRYRLSKLTGISQATLSTAATGKTRLSPVHAAKIAHIAGLDARDAAVVALIELEDEPTERERLERVFFPIGVRGLLLFCAVVSLIGFAGSTAAAVTKLTIGRLSKVRRRRRRSSGDPAPTRLVPAPNA